MSLAVYCQLNQQNRSFVPTVMTPELTYHRGKWDRGEEPVSEHQIRSANGRVERCRVGRLSPRRETKIQGANREVSERKTDL